MGGTGLDAERAAQDDPLQGPVSGSAVTGSGDEQTRSDPGTV